MKATRLVRSACWNAAWIVGILLAGAAPACAGPFDYWYTNSPVIVARGTSSVFDVVPSTTDADRFFMTHWGFSGAAKGYGIAGYEIKRRHRRILPLTDRNDWEENRLWTHAFPSGGANFPKAFDIQSDDANGVRFLSAAEGGRDDGDGSIEAIRWTYQPTNVVTSSLWQDLTGERADGGYYYGPEGLAIDRVRHRVAVVTDSGVEDPPFPPRRQGIRVYSYDPTNFTLSGTVTNFGVLASDDGHNAWALPDGSFLVMLGAPAASNGVWKLNPDTGEAEQLLDRADIEDHSLPGAASAEVLDLMVYGGYLYLAQTRLLADTAIARLLAFEWDEEAQTVKDDVIDGILNLNTIYENALGSGATATGLGVTLRGDLLVSSFQWQAYALGSVVAFTAVPVQHGLMISIK